MMLKTRIKKLELTIQLAADNLIARWERVAMASLSHEEQILVAESEHPTRSKPLNSTAHISAVQSYQSALAATITEVTDEELDRIILSLGPEYGYQPPAAMATS